MSRRTLILAVVVEEKEEPTVDNVAPSMPSGLEVSTACCDVLADFTKRWEAIGWRVLTVRPPRAGDLVGHSGPPFRPEPPSKD
jgi:hypothetical protein